MCEYCCKLHPIDGSKLRFLRRGYNNKSCKYSEQHRSINLYYPLPHTHMHLQLILKYAARVDNHYYQKYLSSLLKPCHLRSLPVLENSPKVKFIGTPQVIDRRLIISLSWRYSRPSYERPFSPDSLCLKVTLCPHSVLLRLTRMSGYQRVSSRLLGAGTAGFLEMIASAFDKIEDEILSHCQRCATGFGIKVELKGYTVAFSLLA